MLIRSTVLLILATFMWSVGADAQLQREGVPVSWNPENNVEPNTAWEEIPVPDVEALLAEDLIESSDRTLPLRFAERTDVLISPASEHGEWNMLHNGDRLWMVGIRSEGAFALGITFDQLLLPPGGYLYIYNADHTDFIGPISREDNNPGGSLTIRPIEGDEIVIEYYEPIEFSGYAQIRVSAVSHAYRDIFSTDFGVRHCAELYTEEALRDVRNLSSSVMMMIVDGGRRAATGVLVNNTRNDGTPYFLTSANALVGDPKSWVFVANFSDPFCGGSSGDCLARTLVGALVLVTDTDSGIALLKLINTPPKDWKTYYSGWDFETPVAGEFFSLQHALAKTQTFSFFEGLPLKVSWKKWDVLRVGEWDNGGMFAGSLGSPLFNADGLVVAQYLGGDAACDGSGADFFGQARLAWPELKPYLDPISGSNGAHMGFYAIAPPEGNSADDSFEVFPNPFVDKVYIRNNSDYPVTGVRVTDNFGRLVKYFVPMGPELDLSMLPRGVYHLHIETSESVFTRRLIRN